MTSVNRKFFEFETIPIGSILSVPASERLPYISKIVALPDSIYQMIASPKTGAVIRGMTRLNQLQLDQSPLISFAVLQVALGEYEISQLPSVLSTKLRIPNDKAQAIAREIEKELLAPIALELNQYLAQKKRTAQSIMNKGPGNIGAQNVLNLKEQRQQPKPPEIPRQGM